MSPGTLNDLILIRSGRQLIGQRRAVFGAKRPAQRETKQAKFRTFAHLSGPSAASLRRS